VRITVAPAPVGGVITYIVERSSLLSILTAV